MTQESGVWINGIEVPMRNLVSFKEGDMLVGGVIVGKLVRPDNITGNDEI